MKTPDRVVRLLGLLSLVPVLGFPLSNPDLFWHLSAARRIRELGAPPAADWLSATRAGAPWTDFEWVSQVLFDALHRGGGVSALWAFKAALMAASALILWKTVTLYSNSVPARSLALALWGAASLTRSDIRPELFSLLGFGLVFLALERRRLGLKAPGPAWFVLLFGLWGNLHPGYVYGLALIGLYAACETAERLRLVRWSRPRSVPEGRSLWLYAAAGALGCLLQPHGMAHFEVIRRHWLEMKDLEAYIVEWKGIRLDDPWHWPFWTALFAAFGSALLLLRRRRWVPLGPLAALIFLGFSASQHSRMAAYFVACAVPLIVYFFHEAGAADSTGRRWLQAALLAAIASFTLARSLDYGFPRTVFNDHFLPRRAAEFLDRHAAELPRPLYNPWGWGGYLGWRLHPKYLVFQDGRYIFHDLLKEGADAFASPEAWRRFLERRRIDLALMQNAPLRAETTRSYPDGTTKVFWRPYYLDYMPRSEWALVYWDEKALLFARRGAVPARWLKLHEYRLLLPRDEGALEDARARGKISEAELLRESARHERELAESSPPGW